MQRKRVKVMRFLNIGYMLIVRKGFVLYIQITQEFNLNYIKLLLKDFKGGKLPNFKANRF